jgi:prophage antirepressor-like protein
MEQLKIFQNPEFGTIRTMSDERGEPLFCAKDVCDALKPDEKNAAVTND